MTAFHGRNGHRGIAIRGTLGPNPMGGGGLGESTLAKGHKLPFRRKFDLI